MVVTASWIDVPSSTEQASLVLPQECLALPVKAGFLQSAVGELSHSFPHRVLWHGAEFCSLQSSSYLLSGRIPKIASIFSMGADLIVPVMILSA